MKKIFIVAALAFALTVTAQEKKQYRSAESGQYVSKSTADKSPSTTYSTPRKSSSTSESTTSTPKSESYSPPKSNTSGSSNSRKSKY